MADSTEPKKGGAEGVLFEALSRDDVPKIYANGFSMGLTNSDIVVVFQRFGPNPVAVLNLSYTLAKTLAQRLGRLVSEFESQVAHQDILTTDRIDEAMKRSESEGTKGAAESSASEPEATKAAAKKTSDVH